MKRSLIIVVPLLLLAVLNACSANGALPPYSSDQWTAIAKTQQVMSRPESERIKFWLNSVPYSDDKFTALEKELIGYFDVTNVGFPKDTYFEIYLNCTCDSGSDCCDPERMFLIALLKVSHSQNQILAEVPETVQDFDVVCLNNTRPFAAVYAPWNVVKTFLTTTNIISAKELKSNISVRSIP
jgi:hypothetical protein